jgi:EpsI family protein
MLNRPSVVASLVLLACLAGYVVLFPPRKIQGTRLAACPMSLAGLPGTQLGLEQTVLDDLDPDDYLVRRYDRPDGLPVWLVIVYFQNARLGAHDPELCYRSQGFRVEDLPAGTIDTALGPISYMRFRAVRGERREQVLCFWYTAGGTALAEVKGWRDRMFFQGLRSNRSFGAFVRISSLEGEEDPNAAGTAIQKVLVDLAPRLPSFFPEGSSKREGSR